MSDVQLSQVDCAKLLQDLKDILGIYSKEAIHWVDKKLDSLHKPSNVYLFFSSAPRFIQREEVQIGTGYFFELHKHYQHNSQGWTADQIARLIILLEVGKNKEFDFVNIVNSILDTADYFEQVTIYKSMIFMPDREFFISRVVDGLRTNISDVFDAISLENAYPYLLFEENAWNQMVLKAIFTGKPLKKIIGIDERTNSNLAQMALGFAHERWAAERSVSPDLWRLTGRYMNEENIRDIQKLISGEEKEKKAAYLICRNSPFNNIQKLTAGLPYEGITWNEIN